MKELLVTVAVFVALLGPLVLLGFSVVLNLRGRRR